MPIWWCDAHGKMAKNQEECDGKGDHDCEVVDLEPLCEEIESKAPASAKEC